MTKAKKKILEYVIVLFVIFCLLVGGWVSLYFFSSENSDFELGVHFSNEYATYLGLNWRDAYVAILDELDLETIRLAAPWDEIEPEKDFWAFGALDWQVEQAANRDVDVILAVGRRTPRWPECHDPEWVKKLSPEIVVDRQLKMIRKVIDRYKGYDNIKIWQVENEPMLDSFGECPPSDLNLLRKEVSFVKTLDKRPIMVTDSGELSFWLAAGNMGDYFGTTLYRVTYNKFLGYSFYHLPPLFYTIKAWLIGRDPGDVYVAELQGEPWAPNGILETDIDEQLVSMDALRLKSHIKYAKRTGFAGAYLWGAEWWYWLAVNGDDSLWQAAKTSFEK
jgi:hypothetical protein